MRYKGKMSGEPQLFQQRTSFIFKMKVIKTIVKKLFVEDYELVETELIVQQVEYKSDQNC